MQSTIWAIIWRLLVVDSSVESIAWACEVMTIAPVVATTVSKRFIGIRPCTFSVLKCALQRGGYKAKKSLTSVGVAPTLLLAGDLLICKKWKIRGRIC